MHVQTQMMGHAAGEPTTMLLAFGGEGLLHAHRQQTPLVQTLGDHAHAGVMDIAVRGTHLRRLETGLLRIEHGLVQTLLQVGELAVRRERTGDVGGVQGIDLDAGIHQQQVAVPHHTGIAHPMQDRGVRAGSDDRIVADRIAQLAGHGIERALQNAFAARLVKRLGQRGQQAVEAGLGGADGLAHLAHLIGVLAHACLGSELAQLVVVGGIAVGIGETVGLAHLVHQLGDLRIGLAHDAHAHGTRLRADILAQRIGQLRDVVRLDAGHRLHLDQAGTRTHPVFAVMRVHEEVGGGIVGTRSHEQFRHMRLAGLRLGRIRVDGIEHQHGARLVVGSQTRVIRERAVRAEHVIAVVVAHLRLAGRNHQTLAGEGLAERRAAGRGELGGFQRLDIRVLIGPAGLHELAERVGIRAQRTVVHTIAHGLIVARRGGTLLRLVFLVLLGDHFTHTRSLVILGIVMLCGCATRFGIQRPARHATVPS